MSKPLIKYKKEQFPAHHDLGPRGFTKVPILREIKITEKLCKTCSVNNRREASSYCQECSDKYKESLKVDANDQTKSSI